MRGRLLLILLSLSCASLTAQTALAQPEPCPLALEDHPSHDTLTLPKGCSAPFRGQLYTLSAHDGIAQDFAALDVLIRGQRAQLTQARSGRELCAQERVGEMRTFAEQLTTLSEVIKAIPEPVAEEMTHPVVWVVVGAAGVALAVGLGAWVGGR